ncbi:glutathione peroxidase [Trichophyton rubrum]|uniref:Glutathione peroxidase n=5 Tax=Trichophyton TaxID=5550 RepID=A0A178ETX4_TRIRU|nr:hypothetical protein H107_08962 [Trichophyton rubrum CBS 202.88]OAL62727.1 glutathione peroxidase [Trichophyton rubrum]
MTMTLRRPAQVALHFFHFRPSSTKLPYKAGVSSLQPGPVPHSHRYHQFHLRRATRRTLSSSPPHTLVFSAKMSSATSFYNFEPVDKKGEPFPLASLKGKVVLVVNTASKCGFTPQFAGLEELYKSITASHPDKFTILGFPCNQFGSQDPGSNDEIQSFCQVNYGVTFPVLGKIDVNGDNTAPVFNWLKKEMPGLMGLKRVKWNFEKFLVDAEGKVVGRWASTTKPESLKATILEEIEKAGKKSQL